APAIRPGAEPFLFPAGKVGCLLIHNFNGSPASVRQMGEYLAGKGFTALGVRMEGHGTEIEDLDRCRYQDWICSAEKGLLELRRHCSTIFVAGISMGGTISLHLAHLHPDKIAGAIAICPSYEVPWWMKLLVPPLKYVAKRITLNRPGTKDRSVVETGYQQISLSAAQEFIKLVDNIRNGLPLITCPVLLIASRLDSTAGVRGAPRLLADLGSADKDLFWVERSGHMVTLDHDKELVFQRTADFIEEKTAALEGLNNNPLWG
ncbi:MAG: alpha/beta fold hydrolase, partial [Firmicutes bacterium]|nr:alpha/beta fold hydrolase [Bacillota bacterium]